MQLRPRRSCLTVPADDERKVAKALQIAVDEVIFDLEDAVAPSRKEAAREILYRALRDREWRPRTLAIRVNRGSSDDLSFVSEMRPDVVVIPKVESFDELLQLSIPYEVQIETARGLVECERIARAPGLEALVLGPGDLAASLGVPVLSIGDGPHVEHALARVLVAARAAGVAAIDGPYPRLGDPDGLRRSAERARNLGYDGKWCIHPAQVSICDDVFTPSAEEVHNAHRVLEIDGVARLDNEMYDEASRRMARAILARVPANSDTHSTES